MRCREIVWLERREKEQKSVAELFSHNEPVSSKTPAGASAGAAPAWRLLIVDDEPEIHAVTRLALRDFSFWGRGLEFVSAFSVNEAKNILENEDDFAVILLDIIMENDEAGFQLVHYIREERNDKITRIILRTGEPSQAPAHNIIVRYDINDYREKSGLTANRLFTSVCAALRAHRDIVALNDNCAGLEKVIAVSANMFAQQTPGQFTESALKNLSTLLQSRCLPAPSSYRALAATLLDGVAQIIPTALEVQDDLTDEIRERLSRASQNGEPLFGPNWLAAPFTPTAHEKRILYLQGLNPLSETEKHIVRLYMRNVSIACEKMMLQQLLDEAQREIVYRLLEAVESRSKETGNHVKRVAQICRVLGRAAGLSKEECDVIFYASPLHDIGKIAIPDAILNKPGVLTKEEWKIMQTHAIKGYKILAGSERPILQGGAVIARDHHEKWDGTGYPAGRAGKDIHIFGRIVAVADVFDALGSRRSYKDIWPLEDILNFLRKKSGSHFDPEIVELLFENLDEILNIRNHLPD